MEHETTYEFKLDQYHNNYANVRIVAKGMDGAKAAGNHVLVDFFERKARDVIVQEEKFFQAGVEAAGGDAKKFLTDVLKSYPDMKDFDQFQVRSQQAGLTDIGLNEAHKTSRNGLPKMAVAQTAVVAIAVMADYKEASRYINNSSFDYLTKEARNEYPHVYASAKIQQNPTLGGNPEFGYSGFRDWAVKVNLHEEDWVKLDPTPITQNNINHGFPVRGFTNSLHDLESSI